MEINENNPAVFSLKKEFVLKLREYANDQQPLAVVLQRRNRGIEVHSKEEMQALQSMLVVSPFKDQHLRAARFLCTKVNEKLKTHYYPDSDVTFALPEKAHEESVS